MVKPQGFIVIDGTSGIEEQQKLVREKVKDILPLIQQQQQQSLGQKLLVTSNE
jgi:hypothetical protein